ncbi:phosphatidylinositol 3,4,5-trisphosphate 5-phosphatase 2-like, partial [Antrostomus carolinensis]|uniref:phosphatidylinositol 3,4,5-trisphosphate 5-phosphatase 2-like n=1 Tax=Antrostomus carolinensis TaxID=279965 RepID=UPI0010A98594
TIQGIQAKCFRTLPDLIGAYQQPNNGLVTPLLYPVHRGRPQRLQEQVHSSPASDFMGFMAEYLSECPGGDSPGGHLPCPHLLHGVQTSPSKLGRCPCWLSPAPLLCSEIDLTLAGLETLARVFDLPMSPRSLDGEQGVPTSDPDLELLLNKISAVNHLLSSLEKKVPALPMPWCQAGEARHNLSLPSMVAAPPPVTKPLAVQSFEVKVGKSQRAALTVDVESGTVAISKRGNGSPEETIPHDKILQLIKYQSVPSKVRLVYNRELQKSLSRDFIFPSARKREAFCQLLQLMKIQHSNLDEPDLISVYIGTWNMGSTPPPRSLASCAQHIPAGNKGAVGVSFLFNGTSFGFINCHLASGSEKTHRRNQNYSDILRSLVLGDKRLSTFDLTLRFTHLFWFGGLNYRTWIWDSPHLPLLVQDILAHLTKKEFEALLAVDQLNLEREKNKVFLQFSEGDISFPPTYRYERGSRDTYLWQKFKPTGLRINVPSWCDRILWKSHPETHVVCNSYGCTDDIVTSDHSPVFATFEVGVTSQFVPKKAPGSDPEPLTCIEWESIEVTVRTSSRSKCYIEFHSYCLEEPQRSGENTSQSCDIPGFLTLGWA